MCLQNYTGHAANATPLPGVWHLYLPLPLVCRILYSGSANLAREICHSSSSAGSAKCVLASYS